MKAWVVIGSAASFWVIETVAAGQDYFLGLVVEEVGCGEELVGFAGETLRLHVSILIDAENEDIGGGELFVGGDGGKIQIASGRCEESCASEYVFPNRDKNFFWYYSSLPDPDLIPETGPLAGTVQGPSIHIAFAMALRPLNRGKTRFPPFDVDLEVPQAGEAQTIHLHYKDGIAKSSPDTVWKTSLFAGANNLDSTSGRLHFADCSFLLKGVSGGGVPGDLNADGAADLTDMIVLLSHLFLGTPERLPCGDGTVTDPGNVALLDFNGDAAVDLSDGIALFEWNFLGSSAHVLGVQCRPISGCPESCR